MQDIKTPQTVWVEVSASERLPDVYNGDSSFYNHSEWYPVINPVYHIARYCVPNDKRHNPHWENQQLEKVYSVTHWLEKHLLPCAGEGVKSADRLWIKVGELITEIDRNILAEDVFDVDFGGSYKLQITNENGAFIVTNAMNGYGDNCFSKYKADKVTFLTYFPEKYLGK